MNDNSLKLEFERRWALLAGLAAVAGVAIYFVGQFYGNSQIEAGDGAADVLTSMQGSTGGVLIGGILQGIGIALLAVPLVFLFKAALARSGRMRSGLIGLVVAAPIFLGIAGALSVGTLIYASDNYEADSPAIVKCVDDEKADFAEDNNGDQPAGDDLTDIEDDCADDEATDLRGDASFAGAAVGFGLAGGLGFAIAIFYSCINAMRVGLLSRFWGSLGMALGVVAIFPQLFIFTLIWFIYLGLLIAGWIPGGRPAAWAAGEAIPWPVPGEQRAGEDDDVIEGSAEEIDPDDPHQGTTAPEPDDAPQIERRKRKKRSDQ